jgi:hypothetical protein
MAYLPGWFVIRMSTNDTGAGGGAFDFFPQRGTATDSISKRNGLLGFLGGGAVLRLRLCDIDSQALQSGETPLVTQFEKGFESVQKHK